MAAKRDPLRQIGDLYHFTDVRNLTSIKSSLAIYSTARLNEEGVKYYPGGDDLSLELDVSSGMDQFVHLCFTTNHPMAHHIKQRNSAAKLIYLRINRSILYMDGVRFSSGIAYADGVKTVPICEAVESNMIDFQILNTWTDWNDPQMWERRHAAEKYEILVPNCVSLDLVRSFPNG